MPSPDNPTCPEWDRRLLYKEAAITSYQVDLLLARGWRPPKRPVQYVNDETPGWVWANNRCEAYGLIGPQPTPWGTMIQAGPEDA